MAISEAGISVFAAYMMALISEGRGPKLAEATIMHAVHSWTQAHPTPTAWMSYDVDGYKFSIRRDQEGRLDIRRGI